MKLFQQISLIHKSPIPIHQQLRQQLTQLIVVGGLKEGDPLPSIRALADQLDISLHTVRHAYQHLETDGLVETRHGRRTRVVAFEIADLLQPAGDVRTYSIGVILPALDPFAVSILEGIEYTAQASHYSLSLCVSHQDPILASNDIARLITRNIDGLIIVSHDAYVMLHPEGEITRLSGLPYVLVEMPDPEGFSVRMDRESGGYQATKHLLDLGHQRIGLITYTYDIPQLITLHQGHQRALEEAGLPLDPNLVSRVLGFDFAAGAQGMKNLLKVDALPTGVMAITDSMALGAMHVLRENGLHIPEDFSVVGFYNAPFAEMVDPPLTTVDAPLFELGQVATNNLTTLIEGSASPPREVVLPTSLIVRQSSGKSKMVPSNVKMES